MATTAGLSLTSTCSGPEGEALGHSLAMTVWRRQVGRVPWGSPLSPLHSFSPCIEASTSGPLCIPAEWTLALTFPPQHRHRMVVLEPLNKLLQEKWDLLIPRFFFNFLCYLIYMFIFTAITYHQPALEKARLGPGGGTCPGEASGNQRWEELGQDDHFHLANADAEGLTAGVMCSSSYPAGDSVDASSPGRTVIINT